jgi:hypothetical protein
MKQLSCGSSCKMLPTSRGRRNCAVFIDVVIGAAVADVVVMGTVGLSAASFIGTATCHC